MAVWKAKLGFHDSVLLGDQDYSFNFHVEAANTSAAWARAENVASAFMTTVMPPNVLLSLIAVSNPDVVNGSLYISQASPGERSVTGDALPGWNVVKFTMSPAAGERQHVFYLRVGLTENDVVGQVVSGTVLTAVDDLITGILAVSAVCDKDGFIFTYASRDDKVHMRQMGWRRRTRPGFKRGWVPA